ncbi:MAG: hypothetical protein HHAS10_08740 [Candidatus Altimarinota bacterium]
MHMHPEIKDFTKNTLIFTLFFTLVLHLSWGYITPYISPRVVAGNDGNFTQANMVYLGSYATAASLSISEQKSTIKKTSARNGLDENITVAEALANPRDAQTKLIGTNMLALQSYVNVLKIDIKTMLEESNDRMTALDEHIEILKSYYTKTTDRMAMLREQANELQRVISESSSLTEEAKSNMETKYKAFEYDGVDSVIDTYVQAKNDENRARVYLAYVERFQRGYSILQAQNRKILDTLINNRDAIIKQVVVVLPDSGTELVKKLNLISTESDYKASLTE